MNQSSPYSVPHEPGRWRAITLAAVVHLALFAFLWFGIRWQNEKPLTVEAEIWSPTTQQAAPVAAQQIAEPQPEPPIEKAPEKILEKPLPVPEPRPVVATPPVAKPDIALEQEKKRKARQEQQKRQQEQERLAQKRLEEERLNEKLAQKEKEALKQAQKEKVAAQAEQEKALAQKKREAAEASKAKAAELDKKRKENAAKAAAEDTKLAKLHDEEVRRMTGGTSGASGSGGSGTAAKSQGNRGDPGYGDRIKGKIKSNTIFNVPNDLNGNPAAVYEVNLLPDGTIRSLRLQKPSGVPGFDEAVKRGIEKSEPYPKDKSGQVPSSFELTYKPKD